MGRDNPESVSEIKPESASETTPADSSDIFDTQWEEGGRNWRKPQSDTDYAAKAGQDEKEALKALGFNMMLDGKEIGVKNGVTDEGLIEERALKSMGLPTGSKYTKLWRKDGWALEKARKRLKDEKDKEAVKRGVDSAVKLLLQVEKWRNADLARHVKGKCKGECDAKCCCITCRHKFQLQIIKECREGLQDFLQVHNNNRQQELSQHAGSQQYNQPINAWNREAEVGADCQKDVTSERASKGEAGENASTFVPGDGRSSPIADAAEEQEQHASVWHVAVPWRSRIAFTMLGMTLGLVFEWMLWMYRCRLRRNATRR